jgi:hypothetical protein
MDLSRFAEQDSEPFSLSGHEAIFADDVRVDQRFPGVKEGRDFSGRVEGEANLSHDGDAWVAGDVWVYAGGRISGE